MYATTVRLYTKSVNKIIQLKGKIDSDDERASIETYQTELRAMGQALAGVEDEETEGKLLPFTISDMYSQCCHV